MSGTQSPPYRSPPRDSLEGLIEQDPLDREAHLVLADRLQEEGDPLGELISHQIAAEEDASLRARADAAVWRYLDARGHGALRSGGIWEQIRWRWGLVREVKTTRSNEIAPVCRLLGDPAARFIEGLEAYKAQAAPLSMLASMRRLEELLLDYNWDEDQLREYYGGLNDPVVPLDLAPMVHLPCLRRLALPDTRVDDPGLLASLVTLRALHIGGLHDAAPLAALGRLESLLLYMMSDPTPGRLDPVARLGRLKQLTLRRCHGVTSIACLAGLDALERLEYFDTPIESLAPLPASLRQLKADCDPHLDLSPLLALPRLEALRLSVSRDNDLTPLASLRRLRRLEINEVEDPRLISNMRGLEELVLRHRCVEDLAFLEPLEHLRALTFDSTNVESFAPLSGLRRLETVRLYCGDPNPDAQAEIKALVPWARVVMI